MSSRQEISMQVAVCFDINEIERKREHWEIVISNRCK